MRPLLLSLLCASCTQTTACKAGTLLLDLTLEGAASGADGFTISLTLPSGTLTATAMHPRDEAKGTLELDFPTSYPANQTITIVVDAKVGGITVGTGHDSFALGATCTRHSLTVASTGTDLAGVDFSFQPDLTPSSSDLAGADFSPAPDLSTVDPDTLPSCGTTASMPICSSAAGAPSPAFFVTLCRLLFPPSPMVPCAIDDDTGPIYYVRPSGNDANDGLTVATAWQTLCNLGKVPPHASVHVAAGQYTSNSYLDLTRAITVKAGWKDDFTDWNPDSYKSFFLGTLNLDNDGAVWGGFRMLKKGINGMHTPHDLHAGTFIHNYVEDVYTTNVGTENYFRAVNAQSCSGHSLLIRCNDIYVNATKNDPTGGDFTSAEAVSIHLADNAPVTVTQDRMCFEGVGNTNSHSTLSAGGADTPSAHSTILLSNNFLEYTPANGGSAAARIFGGGGTLDITLTNNTLTAGHAVAGYNGGNTGAVNWSFANNILFCDGSCTKALELLATGGSGAVHVERSQSNLIFGFADNTVSPPPMAGSGDSNTGSVPSVFTAFYRPSPGGPADGTGDNLFNDPSWGYVVVDLDEHGRPVSGPWDRGAYQK